MVVGSHGAASSLCVRCKANLPRDESSPRVGHGRSRPRESAGLVGAARSDVCVSEIVVPYGCVAGRALVARLAPPAPDHCSIFTISSDTPKTTVGHKHALPWDMYGIPMERHYDLTYRMSTVLIQNGRPNALTKKQGPPGRGAPSRFLWPQLAPYRYSPAFAVLNPAAHSTGSLASPPDPDPDPDETRREAANDVAGRPGSSS